MRLIDEEFTRRPFLGTRRMQAYLLDQGHAVNRKKLQRLYRDLGIEAIYPKPRKNRPHPDHRVYPYLLGGLRIDHRNQVWCADITYVRLRQGFVYLTAVMDWFSRYVLSWQLSPCLSSDFCVSSLEIALSHGPCEIFNTDQGCQFTSHAFTGVLQDQGIQISMDGRGRCFDNIFIERLWRSVKQECIYIKEFEDVWSVEDALSEYFQYYNTGRHHQALGYKTPAQIYGKKFP